MIDCGRYLRGFALFGAMIRICRLSFHHFSLLPVSENKAKSLVGPAGGSLAKVTKGAFS